MGKYGVLKRGIQEVGYIRKGKVLGKFEGLSGAAARTCNFRK